MKIKSTIIKLVAKSMQPSLVISKQKAIAFQEKILLKNIQQASETLFGKDHFFKDIKNYEDFKKRIVVKDYEQLRYYIDKIVAGGKDICWKGKPLYFAKTSGTTSGAKYIPISKESINHHMSAARNALFSYVNEGNEADFFDRKMIFLQGSPVLTQTNGINTGRLSGIVYHHVPEWLVKNRKPSYETNCIEDWEQKINTIVEETYQEDMSLISGIPPWCIMYFEKLLEKTGKKTIQEIFPNFKLFVYGGLNYEPYRSKIQKLIGFDIDTIETFPASEGFFAYQNQQNSKDLLLNVNAGIFYEFVPIDEIFNAEPKRLSLSEVKLNENYVLIVSTNAGLWAYNTGDTVKFTSLDPFKIIVTGRVKYFISAFGEHVISEEIESIIAEACKVFQLTINEFTVAPFVASSQNESSYHEWFIAFENEPNDVDKFKNHLDVLLQEKNIYYKDLRAGNILECLQVKIMEVDGFEKYQKSKGKLGGQNKVVHLSNDRKIAEDLLPYVKKH